MNESTTQQSPSIAKLLPALIRARAAFPSLIKDSLNPHFNNAYASLAAVLEACDKPLGAQELAILQIPVWEAGALVLQTTLCHTSGEWIRATYPVHADVARPQETGKGMTYARRYCYMSVAGIAPEDDDGEAASGRGPNGHASQPTPARPVNPIAARNLASHEGRGGPVARNQPREAPPAWGNGHANGNGHAKPAAPVVDGPPKRGSQLWKWASLVEKERGPGIMVHLEQFGASRGWGTRITAWTDAAVREAYDDALAALELIYDPHADTGDDYDNDDLERDYN